MILQKETQLWALQYAPLPMVKITLTKVQGSTPREAGCFMLVGNDKNLYGTIGGGTLEFHAMQRAYQIMKDSSSSGAFYRSIEKMPLGPHLGQCCGGTVEILYELINEEERIIYQKLIMAGDAIAIPYQANIALSTPDKTDCPYYKMLIHAPQKDLYLYGAGHVARALIYHLEKFAVTIHWADIDASRFPEILSDEVEQLINPDLGLIADYACDDAYHLVMSHDHAIDLQIIDRLLSRDKIAFLGLIGSETKMTRFRKRLHEMGHADDKIAKITCPIGLTDIKQKSPHSIAIAIIAQLLQK